MSYMALYRKWRPDEFGEVKGQEHIVTTLRNQIKNDRVGHAYLFCGTRGTGKTTIAKLMAKAINCEHPVDGSPCNECASCKAIAEGNSINVIEIDAASNNGVDNIRQISNAVQYSPQSGRYLVYIIDEVHMLSMGAFNALLKTLEEPPEYVMFILATTESHKIPITISSRCQKYEFRRISIETIADRLADLLERENIKATNEALAYVAKAADGSMRDALSILDQCISYNLGKELTYDAVLETIGAVDTDVYIELFSAVSNGDTATAVEIIDKLIWKGKDISQFLNEFTGFIRNVLMLKLDSDMKLEVSSDNRGRLVLLGADITEEYLINYINILQETATKVNYSTAKRVMLEVGIIKMSKPQMQTDFSAIEKRIGDLESKLESGDFVVNKAQEISSVRQITEEPSEELSPDKLVDNIVNHYGAATFEEIKDIVRRWSEIKGASTRPAREYLSRCRVTPSEIPNTIELIITKSGAASVEEQYFDMPEHIQDLKNIIVDVAKRNVEIVVKKQSLQEIRNNKVNNFDFSKIKFNININ